MSQTVIGVFETPAAAERVKQELITERYSPESIRILSNENDGFAEGAVSQVRNTTGAGSGVVSSIEHFFQSLASLDTSDEERYTRGVSAGGALLAATVQDERVESVASLLEVSGARDMNEHTTTPGKATGDNTYGGAAGIETGRTAIPVLEEELHVGKRQVQRGGVRVYSHLTERPVEEEVRLREEHVRVQRNPVNRPASSADLEAFKDATIELTETAEEPVVAKQARIVEEVRVGKDVTERTQTVKDKVRRTEVDVEEIPSETTPRANSAGNP
ncbi:MAG: DUF2382 domain-containing protein [Bryobacteraceae bacterium]